MFPSLPPTQGSGYTRILSSNGAFLYQAMSKRLFPPLIVAPYNKEHPEVGIVQGSFSVAPNEDAQSHVSPAQSTKWEAGLMKDCITSPGPPEQLQLWASAAKMQLSFPTNKVYLRDSTEPLQNWAVLCIIMNRSPSFAKEPPHFRCQRSAQWLRGGLILI